MNVSLTPELERLVNDKIKTGMYQTASEVVRDALRLLQQRDEQRQRLRADVQAGLEDIRRGRYSEYDSRSGVALANAIKTRGRKRLTQQKKTASR